MNDLNWKAVQAAHARDMGVFIISPNDKGGKLQEPAPKMTELCAPLTPMQFNDLYCLARPEVHTLSCGASRPTDFDEHVAALKYYDRIPETIAPIEKRLRAEMEKALGRDWVRTRWISKACRTTWYVPGEIQRDGKFLRLWTYTRNRAGPVELGEDALQPAGPGGTLVPGTKRSLGGGINFPGKTRGPQRHADTQSLRGKNPRHPRRGASVVL